MIVMDEFNDDSIFVDILYWLQNFLSGLQNSEQRLQNSEQRLWKSVLNSEQRLQISISSLRNSKNY